MPELSPREWAIYKFDTHGPFFIDRVVKLLQSTHQEHSRAQSEISSKRQGVYGQTNPDLQSRLREICQNSNIPMISVKPRSPKVPLLNGKILVAWRYGHTDSVDVLARRFGTSEYRANHFNAAPPSDASETLFDWDASPAMNEEDEKLRQAVKNAAEARLEELEYYPVIVLAYASNASGIHKAIAAEAKLLDDGRLALENVCDFSNIANKSSTTSATKKSKSFDKAPQLPTGIKARTSNDEEH